MCAKHLLSLFAILIAISPLQASKFNILTFGGDRYYKITEKPDMIQKYARKANRELVRKIGYRKDAHIKLVTGKSATVSRLAKELSVLIEKSRDEDFTMIWLTCHGINHESQLYLLFMDSYVPFSDVQDKLSEIKGRVFLILETCHSGAAINNVESLPNNLTILCSSRHNEISYMGVIPNAVIAGLKKGDYNKDGLVTVKELCRYVVQNTKRHRPNLIGCAPKFVLFKRK